MPPRPMLPNQPAGATDLVPYNPYATGYPGSPSSSSAAQTRGYRFAVSSNGPMYLPGDLTDEEAAQAVKAYDAYIATLTQAWQESSGLQRRQIESQIEDAKIARQNAMQIAQLQAETSRYGTDVQRQTRLDELRQNQRQFDATHGLDVAKAYTEYAKTPDMMFARNDFMNAMGRVGQGLGPKPITSATPSPKAKTWADWSALTGYSTPTVQANRSGGGGGAPVSSPASGGGAGTDPRVSAANAVMKAIPPSDDVGNDEQDWAALRAIQNLYVAKRPGSVEKLGAARQKIANAGLARLGYDPARVNEDYMRSRPGQASVRRA